LFFTTSFLFRRIHPVLSFLNIRQPEISTDFIVTASFFRFSKFGIFFFLFLQKKDCFDLQ